MSPEARPSGRVVIAGGTGFLGRNLARHLAALGCEVVVLSRHVPRDAPGWRHVPWDARTTGEWVRQLDGAAALVNLVGRTVDCRKTPDHCDEILRSRVEATEALGRALRQTGTLPRVWVQMSTAHRYGDPPEVLIDEGSAFGYGLAPLVGQAWEEAFGLKTDQIGSEFGVFLTQRTAGEYDLARNGWGADYPHANNQIAGLFTCGGGNNDQQYCNPQVDELLTQAASEQDQAAQQALYEQANKIIADDAAALFLRWGVNSQLVRPYVGGLQVTPMDSQVPGEHFYESIQMLVRQ